MKHKFTHPKDAPEGHEWVTTTGEKATQVTAFDGAVKNSYSSIVAMIDGRIQGFAENGSGIALNLIDAPRTRTVWVNFDSDGIAFPYDTKADALADDYDNDIIARKRVEYVEGEFDE